MIDLLKRYVPTLGSLEETSISYGGLVVGWHSTFISESGVALGGGCGSSLKKARRIAVAEIIERRVFNELFLESPIDFSLDKFPTSCGFAAGFDNELTKYRAVAEAVERWALSQWIDYKYALEPLRSSEVELGSLAAFFCGQFEEVLFFRNDISVLCDEKILNLQFGTCVGLKDGGAFPGARVCSMEESPWEHCLIEAWRHTLIAKEGLKKESTNRQYRQRVIHFGSKAKLALDSIQSANRKENWPEPTLSLLKKAPNAPAGTYVWRALCANYVGWHIGGPDRFVY